MKHNKPRPRRFRDVFVPLPYCGWCGRPCPRVYKTITSRDGSKCQYAKCQCGRRSKIIWEPPENIPLSGKASEPVR